MSDYLHPSEYEVIPKAWKIIDHPRFGTVVAAMLPYPVLHPEDAGCLNDPTWVDDNVQLTQSNGRAGGVRDTPTGEYMRGVCGRCTLQVACREYGIAHESALMLGGLTPQERAQIRAERRQVLVEPHEAYKYGLGDEYLSAAVYTRGESDAEG